MEDAQMLEKERERANSTRLDRSVRFRQTPAIVAGVLALVAGIAAVVW
jgi:hypothetical protein